MVKMDARSTVPAHAARTIEQGLNTGVDGDGASVSRALHYADAHRQRFLSELKEFVRFPSVSAQPRHAGDVKKCAAWLAQHLRRIGLQQVSVFNTPRHPIVYAEWRGLPNSPTLLIYGHFDVQPPDPLDAWQSPPFEPALRGDNLYGRGASDDKGQLLTHLKALESYLKTEGRLPVNVKCLFEGEEEIGSTHLKPFLSRHRRALAADVAVMSDTRMLAKDRPALTYALRGGLSLELELLGTPQDLHSGNFGGAIHNPAQALCELVSQLHDKHGRIAIPGIYDEVRVWSDEERDYMARNGPDDARILRSAKAGRGWGERGYTLYERTTIRPALTINGITSGYQGPGSKSIIPARAVARINFRLVPDQKPERVERLFRQHISRLTPPTLRSKVSTSFAARPALLNRKHPAMRAASLAYQRAFHHRPVFLRSGGTIPVVNTFQETLGIQTVLMGFALPDDRIHAPNEKFHLPNFYKGIATCIWFLSKVGAQL
jgi:acetylornithine deacetylase/succinyl-diaminopimelate desuccinylase-like protein